MSYSNRQTGQKQSSMQGCKDLYNSGQGDAKVKRYYYNATRWGYPSRSPCICHS